MTLAERLDDAERWIADGIDDNNEQFRALPEVTRLDMINVLLFIRWTRMFLDGELRGDVPSKAMVVAALEATSPH